jgi:hypothetical protein
MKILRSSIPSILALASLTLGVSFAADIDGKWTAQVQGREGPRTETLMLKADGSTLTGSMQGPRGEPIAISNGTIDGNAVAFTVTREFRDNKITQEYKGTISGSELKLTMSGGRRGPVEMTYKKE